jgi:hypothetical protein
MPKEFTMKKDQKTDAKKLSIKRETLRQLTNRELASAAGGTGNGTSVSHLLADKRA